MDTSPDEYQKPLNSWPKSYYLLGLLAVIIIAAGVYVWLDSISLLPGSTTKNWQTYTSNDFGFTIKHPDTWSVKECLSDGYGIIGFGESENVLVCSSDAPPTTPVNIQIFGKADLFDSYVEAIAASLENVTRTNLTIDGSNAVKLSGTTPAHEGPGFAAGTSQTMVLFPYADKIYQIFYVAGDSADYSSVFESMIGSFKTIN